MVGRPCGQFQGRSIPARFRIICEDVLLVSEIIGLRETHVDHVPVLERGANHD